MLMLSPAQGVAELLMPAQRVPAVEGHQSGNHENEMKLLA